MTQRMGGQVAMLTSVRRQGDKEIGVSFSRRLQVLLVNSPDQHITAAVGISQT